MSTFTKFREESRKDWGVNLLPGNGLTLDQIKTGCLLRIADAVEPMSKNYAVLIDERDRAVKRADKLLAEVIRLKLSNAALRGQITKLKKARNA